LDVPYLEVAAERRRQPQTHQQGSSQNSPFFLFEYRRVTGSDHHGGSGRCFGSLWHNSELLDELGHQKSTNRERHKSIMHQLMLLARLFSASPPVARKWERQPDALPRLLTR
jgi:hypothetical protein